MKVSLISSLYRTDVHIRTWSKKVMHVARALEKAGTDFELVAVANDPTETETAVLEEMQKLPWFKLVIVPRESLYASWNRGIRESTGEVCGFWNVDDARFAGGIIDGTARIASGADLVYFPFIYKRYIKILGIPLLVKVKIFQPPQFDKEEFSKAMHCGPFFMFSKKLFDIIGEFDGTFRIAGDYEWCVRAAQAGMFEKSERLGGVFTNDGTTLSGSRNTLQQDENIRVLSTHKTKTN